MENNSKQKNVIILGAATGIGRATVEAFVQKEYGLALGDINIKGLDALKRDLTSLKAPVWANHIDVADPAQVGAFVKGACEALGHLDVLIYAAGIGRFCPLVDIGHDQWNREIAVNLSGAFYSAQAVAQQMIRQESGGVFLFLSSTGATHACNQASAYCVSKSGLNMLVKCLASELGNFRIRANAVMPGAIETRMVAPMLQKEMYPKMLKATIPAGRWAQAKEVAALLIFLASDEASYINGQTIAIDGGYTTRQVPEWWPLNYSKDQKIDWYELFDRYPFK